MKITKRSEKIVTVTYKIMIEREHFIVPGAKVDTAGMKRLLAAMSEKATRRNFSFPPRMAV